MTCKYPTCEGPNYVDEKGKVHGYCSKECLTRHKEVSTSLKPTTQQCKTKGCFNKCYVSTNGKVLDYCCLYCKETKGIKVRQSRYIRISHLRSTDSEYQDIMKQYDLKWLHTEKKKPKVASLIKVLSIPYFDKFQKYRLKVASEHQKIFGFGSIGNTQRRFHGTNYSCNLGLNGTIKLCSDSRCSLCSIVRTGWDLSKVGSKNKFKRFGNGLYFTGTSSKAFDYTSKNSSGHKAIIVSNLVVGNGFKLDKTNTSFVGPKPGYHSLLGEVGSSLNYDEVVVYKEEAAIPAFIIILEPEH